MRKILSVLLTIAMLASLVILPVSAAGSVTPIDGVMWEYDGETKVLTFTGNGAVPDYDIDYPAADTRPWAKFAGQIEEVRVGSGITGLGANSFKNLTALKFVALPEGLVEIGERVFPGTAITSIELPSTLRVIGNGAFMNTGLTSVSIPEGVTVISDEAFYGCPLSEVEFPSTLKVVGSKAFYETALTSLTLPNGTESIGAEAFAGTPIKTMTLPESVAALGDGAFMNCSELTGVMIPGGIDAVSPQAFSGCTALEYVVMPGGLTKIGYRAFSGCTSLSVVPIPDSVTEIGAYSFENCDALTELRLSAGLELVGDLAFTSSGIKRIVLPDSAFGISNAALYGLDALEELYISDSNENYILEDDILYSPDKTVVYACFKGDDVKSITLPDTVSEIGYGAFYGMTSLDNIILPESVRIIGDRAFRGCGITELRVPAGTETIGANNFEACGRLRNLLIVGKDTAVDENTFENYSGKVYAWAASPTYAALEKDGTLDRFVAIDNELGYLDVSASKWSYESIEYAVNNGLFRGMSTMYFMPEVKMNRAMLVTVLHRMEGEPAASEGYELPFTDVPEGAYYYDAVMWAAENEVVNGVTPTTFDPNANITREQMVTVLYRYASKDAEVTAQADLSIFADADKVSDYAVEAMKWAVAEGIIAGIGAGENLSIDPKGEATREQVATVLMRYTAPEEPPVDGENPDAENPDEENPDEENPDVENPDEETPDAENPDTENPEEDTPVVDTPVEGE